MKKYYALPIKIQKRNFSDSKSLTIDFSNESIQEWCLGLFLLKEELITSLVVSNKDGSYKIEIFLHLGQSRAKLSWTQNGAKLGINQTELDYWVSFFLKYYRDGISDVDHIDVDIPPNHAEKKGVYVTLRVPNAVKPVSPEEARRRLGL